MKKSDLSFNKLTATHWFADLAPPEEGARFLGLANICAAGAAAVTGPVGLVIGWVNGMANSAGYSIVFAVFALAFVASILFLRKVVVLPEASACGQLSEV